MIMIIVLIGRFLFWSTEGIFDSIYRADLGGNKIWKVLRSTEKIKTISLDFISVKLFWIQHDTINEISYFGTCDYNGHFIKLYRQMGRYVYGYKIAIKKTLHPSAIAALSMGADFYWGAVPVDK